jgi:hypothetical protein
MKYTGGHFDVLKTGHYSPYVIACEQFISLLQLEAKFSDNIEIDGNGGLSRLSPLLLGRL